MDYSRNQVEQVADDLRQIVDDARHRLGSIDEEAASTRPAPAKWSYKEIIGHLIDSATNNHQRFVRAQNESLFVFPGYAQNEWVQRQEYNERPWIDLLDLWRQYNHHIAHVMVNIPEEKLEIECRIGDYEPHSLGYLVIDYVVHLKHHLKALP